MEGKRGREGEREEESTSGERKLTFKQMEIKKQRWRERDEGMDGDNEGGRGWTDVG